MKRLLRYLNAYKKETVLAPLFKMLEASFELFVPLVVAQIVDVGIKNQDAGYILRMGGLLILLGVIGLTCSITAQYFAAKAAVGFATGLRNDLFAHIGSLSYSEQDTIGTSTLITRMTSDINQVQSGVNLTLRLLLRSPFIVFGAMIMAFTVNAKAAMVFVVAIPVLSVIVFGIMAISMPLYKKVQKQLDHVTQATRENLTGARVIRAFNRQEDEIQNFDESNGLLVKFQVFVGKISALMNPLTYVVVNLSIIAVVWISGKQVDAGIITQGETVALVNYMSQILVELIKMANLIVSISKALACANRISNVLEEKSSIVSPAKGMEQVPAAIAEIGVVPQKAILFKGTLRENMKWGKKDATDEEIYRALDIAQAREFVDSKEKGLDLYIDQAGKNLSGGQKQRLTIARALVREPEILIMDDSASALDFATDAKLRMAIQKGTKDMTVFIVSQRATTIRHADQIVVLDDGAAVGIGTHEELFESCEVYREICLSQLSKEEVQ